ncbi:DNA-3-methyladenine glycosylase 2 family protein [Danxiaibacter flavus]|uniref:DNA-3-methyladenine glycosylase II n=1 Tax=Danxiaibacter flavus TaxID=3049108 RepID=A0ABV3ZNH0_9BACT|nr:DNA-3-methyladenine glycosylase 2 family protein [Chitinophagaceae bacterium DXS]
MEYLEHLHKDKKLSPVILQHGPMEELKIRKHIPFLLMASIMSQQLSTKVASVIKTRFLDLYGGKIPPSQQVLDTPSEQLRAIGLSNAKVSYIKNVAAFCIEHKITDKKLMVLSNEEIIDLLTQIKGVGRWTVEMLLMFSLGREDIFAIDDWGLQNAVIKIYKLKIEDKKKLKEKIIRISSRWSPYRSYASLYLWRWKDNAPVTSETKSKK